MSFLLSLQYCPGYIIEILFVFELALLQSDPYYARTTIIRGFRGKNLVRSTFLKYSQTSVICASIIRSFQP